MQVEQGWKWEAKRGPAKTPGLRETFGPENGSAAFSAASLGQGVRVQGKPGAADRAGLERGCQKDAARRAAPGEVSGLRHGFRASSTHSQENAGWGRTEGWELPLG